MRGLCLEKLEKVFIYECGAVSIPNLHPSPQGLLYWGSGQKSTSMRLFNITTTLQLIDCHDVLESSCTQAP